LTVVLYIVLCVKRMTKVTDIVDRWKNNGIHPLEDPQDVVRVLKEYGFKIEQGGKGSHLFIISHGKLKGLRYQEMGIGEEYTIPVASGRKIKKPYIKNLLKYIELLEAQDER
jgi:predicted RNA binding protein YcfA (HicA-like mRNA interferase family)